MKWITHQIGGFLTAIALQLPAAGICAALAGSILPDILDQKLSGLGRTRKQRQKIFNQVHRGASHWFGWWLGLLLAPLVWLSPGLAPDIAAGLAIGGLSHVALDMLTTMGVPILPFCRRHKVSLHLCSTGKAGEYVFLSVMVCAGIFYFWTSCPQICGNFLSIPLK